MGYGAVSDPTLLRFGPDRKPRLVPWERRSLRFPGRTGEINPLTLPMKPPLLPSEILRRLLRVARFDGMSVLGVAGAFALISAASRDVSGAVIGLMVAAAGAIELHGVGMLRVGRIGGMRWLVASQAYLLATLLGYAGMRLMNPDIAQLKPIVTAELAAQIQQAGMSVDQFLLEFLRLVYVAVAAVTTLYQGGMVIYYLRRRTAVEIALQEQE
jgi:hypothetical protein